MGWGGALGLLGLVVIVDQGEHSPDLRFAEPDLGRDLAHRSPSRAQLAHAFHVLRARERATLAALRAAAPTRAFAERGGAGAPPLHRRLQPRARAQLPRSSLRR